MPNLSGTISDFSATAALNAFQYLNPNVALIQSEVVAILNANLPLLITEINSTLGYTIPAISAVEAAPLELDEYYIGKVLVGFNSLSYEGRAPRNFNNLLNLAVYLIEAPVRSPIQVPQMWQKAEAVSGVLYQYLNGYCTEDEVRLWGRLTPLEILPLPEKYSNYSGTTVTFEMEVQSGGRAWRGAD